MSIINPTSVYELTRPGRMDPKFVGIGQVYTQYKHKRKQVQKIYHDTQNSLLYVQKTNFNLSKSLEQKQKQVQRLLQIRERHQDDHLQVTIRPILQKLKQNEKRRIKIQQLRQKATFQRKKLKSSIQERMTSLRQQRKKDKNEIKNKSIELRHQLQTSQQNRLTMRKTMYNTISSQKQSGSRKVDEFYRQRILQSLSDYKNQIKHEDDKVIFFQQSIEKMNQTISAISQKNQKKQQRLLRLQEKIHTLNPLKSFFSTRFAQNLNEMSFSRKSSSKSISSKKPSEILLEDKLVATKNALNNQKKDNRNFRDLAQQNPESLDFVAL